MTLVPAELIGEVTIYSMITHLNLKDSFYFCAHDSVLFPVVATRHWGEETQKGPKPVFWQLSYKIQESGLLSLHLETSEL